MNRMNWLKITTCGALALSVSGAAMAQSADKDLVTAKPAQGKPEIVKPKETPPATAPTDKAVDPNAWEKAKTPGEMHARMAKEVGTWDAVVKMTMPNAPPEESHGTMKIEMVLGGRFQHARFEGLMMGTPFEGMGTTGFDNQTQTFQGSWVDSFSTSTMFLTGKLEGDKLVMTGEMRDPSSGKIIKEKQVISHVSDDKMVAAFSQDIEGLQVGVMTITYTRAAAKVEAPKPTVKEDASKAIDERKKAIEEQVKKAMEEAQKPKGK